MVDAIADTGKALEAADDIYDAGKAIAKTDDIAEGIGDLANIGRNIYPGDDASKSPGKEFEWRGSSNPSEGKGNWYNPKTGEKWNADLDHGDPIGPHWDYTDSRGNRYRVFPDGHMERK